MLQDESMTLSTEGGGSMSKAKKPARKPAARKTTAARKPAARQTTAARKPAAKKTTSTRATATRARKTARR